MKWHLGQMGQIYECGERTVVYFDPDSGDTHLLSDFAGFLIRELAGKTLTLQQIIDLVSQEVEPEGLPDIADHLPTVLNDLVALDVIEQA